MEPRVGNVECWFDVLKKYGINVAGYRLARDAADAVRCARELGYPVVVKALSPDVLHKTEYGAVKLNIHTDDDVKLACKAIEQNMERFGKRLTGYLIQKQISKGVELIVGGKRDPQFGQLIIFGLGGIFVEVYKDISVRVCPITRSDAKEMINEIKAHPILSGARGSKPVNERKLTDLLLKTCNLLMDTDPDELDLNPVIADENGYTVVDVRVITSDGRVTGSGSEQPGRRTYRHANGSRAKSFFRKMKHLFAPRSVAVIGASRHPGKIGNVIVKNLIDNSYPGKIYPVNPNATEILGLRCYPTVLDVPGRVDSAVIAVPARLVPNILEQCGRKGVRAVTVISGGFREVGNADLERRITETADRYGMIMLGPNVMGVFDAYSHLDTIFLPHYKVQRPKTGHVSVITQSGAVGGCLLDLMAYERIGISKFASYGNAAQTDESDLLEYLAADNDTKTIVMYMEGTKNSKRFMETLSRVCRRKPVIVLKAGNTEKGSKAALSHTGTLAGSAMAYRAVFRQTRAIQAETLNDLFLFTKVLSLPKPKGKRVAIITNGGGNGVLAADAVERHGLHLARFSQKTVNQLKTKLPEYTNIRNPLDLIGDADADRYAKVLDVLAKDSNIDMFVVIVLFQTVSMNDDIINVLIKRFESFDKPLVVVATGGEYTQRYTHILSGYGIPAFSSPNDAVRSLSVLYNYWSRRS